MRARRAVVPGALKGQGGYGRQSKIQRADIGRRRMEIREAVFKGLRSDSSAQLHFDIIEGDQGQVTHLADDQYGMALRISLLEFPIERNLHHLLPINNETHSVR